MTTAAETERIAVRERESVSTRIVAMLGKAPVHIALIVLAVIWLVPTIGLLVTSFRPRPDIASSGWWTAFANFDFTLKNYDLVLNANKMAPSFVNSAIIAIPSTLLPLFIGSLAAYAFSWIKFPFRVTIFLALIALMVVPIQGALVPILIEFQDLGEFLTGPEEPADGLVLGHLDRAHGLRASLLHLPLAELLHHASTRPDRGGPRRRRVELEDLPQHHDPAVGAGARVGRDLPVPLGVERPAHGAGVHPGVRPVADDDQDQPAAVH